ncbi:Rv1733c family protein [Streptomyces sp. enrichment culture]|uniref:Rv1733c family protein n=1 Tax=Streptomyces sp. enrichment culture TaxID=1795815 RepID=UPI003F5592F6
MRAISGLWRWRHNPLCRTTDLVEAWVALAALLLMLLSAPVAGALVGGAAQDSLREAVREQHASRQQVTATVVRELDRTSLGIDPETDAAADLRSRVLADWTAPDGTERHGAVMTSLRDPRPGDRFRMWTDEQGRTAARPLDSATATTHAVLAGFGAALAAAGGVETVRRLIVWRMVRRRYARLDQAWSRVGPDWGRTGTGS